MTSKIRKSASKRSFFDEKQEQMSRKQEQVGTKLGDPLQVAENMLYQGFSHEIYQIFILKRIFINAVNESRLKRIEQ